MSSFRKLEKAVAVPGSFLESFPENLSNPDKFLLNSRDCDMLFLPGLGHFQGRPWAVGQLEAQCKLPFSSPFHEENRVFASLAVASLAIRIREAKTNNLRTTVLQKCGVNLFSSSSLPRVSSEI